jgi:polyphosphate kinase 2 (PPK2 family)
LLKYWFSVSDEEQEMRFHDRTTNPAKRWKFSAMDLESWDKWQEYSRAKDEMFKYTDTKQAPWYIVEADDKKKARLNCISHILEIIPHEDLIPEPIDLPPRNIEQSYIRPPLSDFTYVAERF